MKSIAIVNKVISQKLNKPLNLVTLVNEHYWKTSRDKLINYEVSTIFYKHIGSITVSKYKIYREIKNVIKRIRIIRENIQYSEEAKEKVISQNIDKLTKLLVHRNQIAQEQYDRRVQDINLEESEEDSIDINVNSDED